ncbi:MAG TPA: DNA translocase FtsK [bacterium]|nr:DNA translocase FtsK [bacterium]
MKKKRKNKSIRYFTIILSLLLLILLTMGFLWNPPILSYPSQYLGYWGFTLVFILFIPKLYWVSLWSLPLFILFNWAGVLGTYLKTLIRFDFILILLFALPIVIWVIKKSLVLSEEVEVKKNRRQKKPGIPEFTIPEKIDNEKKEPRIRKGPQKTELVSIDAPNPSFKMPPFSLLNETPKKQKSEELGHNSELLESTLESFGVSARVVNTVVGPTVTRYELSLATGVKVNSIMKLSNDIALALAAPQIRIESPIPGKSLLGIEVPNKKITLVTIREIIESEEFVEKKSRLTLGIGKDIAGNIIADSLEDMPHLLIGGTTGSGKSVCLNALVISLLYKSDPSMLRITMIDPKRVELTQYEDIPHLWAPIITEPEMSVKLLRRLTREMDRRYELFRQEGVRNIQGYNLKKKDSPLYYIVVIVDELADLMMVAPKEIERLICRLAQMARATGIHLIIATQRPSVDVITGLIKANFPSRIAFAVSSQADSRVILDIGGAEKLLGKGDMLYSPIWAMRPVRVQGAYVSDEEIEKVLNFWKLQGTPNYAVTQEELESEDIISSSDSESNDEYLEEAKKILKQKGGISTSLLQRMLRIGYGRAARIIDLLEAEGYVERGEDGRVRVVRLD